MAVFGTILILAILFLLICLWGFRLGLTQKLTVKAILAVTKKAGTASVRSQGSSQPIRFPTVKERNHKRTIKQLEGSHEAGIPQSAGSSRKRISRKGKGY